MTIFINLWPLFSISIGKTVQICHRINQKGLLWPEDKFRESSANQIWFWGQKWLIWGAELPHKWPFLSISSHSPPFWLAEQSRNLSPGHRSPFWLILWQIWTVLPKDIEKSCYKLIKMVILGVFQGSKWAIFVAKTSSTRYPVTRNYL